MLTPAPGDWDSSDSGRGLLQEWELAALEREWGPIVTAGCWSLKELLSSSTNDTAVAGAGSECNLADIERCCLAAALTPGRSYVQSPLFEIAV